MKSLPVLLLLLLAGFQGLLARNPDVLIYGGTPAGIAAALRAADLDCEVLLVEPTSRIGGLISNGLNHPDFRTFEAINGFFREFNQRTLHHYEETYGKDSQQVKDSLRGTHPEPHVAQKLFEEMLAEYPNIRVLLNHRLDHVGMNPQGDSIQGVTVENPSGGRFEYSARVFIDGSYEGDLMAEAGVPYHVGREGREVYGEDLAPEEGDDQLQGYNFRLTMTQVETNRIPAPRVAGYDRKDYVAALPLLQSGKIKRVFHYPSGAIYKAHLPVLPNGKHDINDVSRGLIRLSLPAINNEWPEASPERRRELFMQHVSHNIGLLYFLQNDSEVPEKFRTEALSWGFCRDEFTDNGGLPEQLYVREGRRMKGVHLFTEKDTQHAKGDARGLFQPDAIAMGDYGPNCHGTGHEGPLFGGKHTGEFYKRVPPYQIPYGVILPKGVNNLLVPVAASSSHVGFCALRLEPIWGSLGEAAGVAAGLAVRDSLAVQSVETDKIRSHLHAKGAATIYVSDVQPDSRDFEAVQWWGSLGGLRGLNPQPEKPGERGAHLTGQYYHAFPGHGVDLDLVLDQATRRRWMVLVESLGIDTEGFDQAKTRGQFIQKAFATRIR